MATMQAFVRTSSQDQNVELAEVPIPTINDNEVLVKIHAFGVGIHDRYFIPDDAVFPYVIGTEAAGTITKSGAQVTRFQPQDRVILTSVLQPKGGCWAEFAAVPEDALMPMPDGLEFTVGAAIPVAGKTAIESMRAIDLAPRDSLFVAGASGAIGSLVIQLAAAQGVKVVGLASQKNGEFMLSLGAERAVDYSDPNWKLAVKQWFPEGVTAALAIQPGTAEGSMEVVKDGGTVITVSGDQVESKRNISVRQFQHHTETQDAVVKLVSDVAENRVRVNIERVYPFADAIEALQKTETRHARGKVVVRLD